jgi:hypothetical protein
VASGTSVPVPPPPPLPDATVAGVVYDPVGGQPVSEVHIYAFVETGLSGFSSGRPIASDAAGRYQLTGLPNGATVWVAVWKDGYFQQCAAPVLTVHGDLTLDVPIMSRSQISASSSPLPSAPGTRVVSGVVFETTADGRRPVPNAVVDFEPIMDFPAAETSSDAQGRYLMCGLPDGETIGLGAGLARRVGSVSVPPGQTTADIDIQ